MLNNVWEHMWERIMQIYKLFIKSMHLHEVCGGDEVRHSLILDH